MKKGIIYLKILTNLLIFIISFIFIILLLPKIIGFFTPFVIGWIIAMIAEPLVRFLENKLKIVRKHGTALIITFVIILVTASLYLIILLISKEVKSLLEDMPRILVLIEKQYQNISYNLTEFSKRTPLFIQNIISKMINETDTFINKKIEDFDLNTVINAGTYAKSAIQGFIMTIITIMAAYLFIVNKEEIKTNTSSIIPKAIKDGWKIIVDNFKSAMGGYFKAQFKIMLVVAAIVLAGLLLLGVKYAILITIIIAVFDFLPILGAGGILWPWAIIDMISGNYLRAILLIVIYIIVQIVRQVLQPKFVADSIGISPLSTLIFMYIGYKFYGLLGMIFGIPVGMIIVNLYRIGVFDSIIKGLVIAVQDINDFRKY